MSSSEAKEDLSEKSRPSRRKRQAKADQRTFGALLIELRNRLFIAAAALLVGIVIGWVLSDVVWDLLRVPIDDLNRAGRNASITYGDVGSGFDVKILVSLLVGVVVSAPVWLYQLWAIFARRLKGRQKWYAVGFLGTAIPLFLLGIWTGWSVLPNIVRLMSSFQPEEDSFYLNARSYLDFAVKLMLAVGIGFIIPVFLVMLNFAGVLAGKTILGSWRIAIVAIVLFAGITTPAADLMSMFLLAAPITALFFLAAGIAILNDRRASRRRSV